MAVSHDVLIRFVYGELPPDEARSVTIELERDPELRALVDQQRKLRARLEGAHAPESGDTARVADIDAVPNEPVPRATATPATARNLVAGGAAIVGLLLGVLVAGSLGLGADIRNERGVLIAGGSLARALSQQLSGGEGQTLVVASFWSSRESFCRSFVTKGRTPNALAGIACREGGQWQIVALGEASKAAGASGGDELPPLIRNGAMAIMAGETLDEPAERALRAQDWRPR